MSQKTMTVTSFSLKAPAGFPRTMKFKGTGGGFTAINITEAAAGSAEVGTITGANLDNVNMSMPARTTGDTMEENDFSDLWEDARNGMHLTVDCPTNTTVDLIQWDQLLALEKVAS